MEMSGKGEAVSKATLGMLDDIQECLFKSFTLESGIINKSLDACPVDLNASTINLHFTFHGVFGRGDWITPNERP
jgi:hypothetical protein